jgi:hypothetical protein
VKKSRGNEAGRYRYRNFNAISTETECGETKLNFESTEPKILFESNSNFEDEHLDEKRFSTRQTMNMLENNEIFYEMSLHHKKSNFVRTLEHQTN